MQYIFYIYYYITIIIIIIYYIIIIIINMLYLLLYYIIFLYNVIFIEYCFNLSNITINYIKWYAKSKRVL